MQPIIITGIGTNVGKTIVSAIMCEALSANYWKPIQCGQEKDAFTIKTLTTNTACHEESYVLKHPLAPTTAALKENITINPLSIRIPKTQHRLVIEGCGGVMVPINETILLSDLFCAWNPLWIVVSKNYLGSINHTLLTYSFLKSRAQQVLGIVFNGRGNQKSEQIILTHTSILCLGRIKQEREFNNEKIKSYAKKWHPHLASLYKC